MTPAEAREIVAARIRANLTDPSEVADLEVGGLFTEDDWELIAELVYVRSYITEERYRAAVAVLTERAEQ